MSLHQPIGRETAEFFAFDEEAREAFAAAYPDRHAHLRHCLADHPLLSLTALAQLAERMPAERVEYNRGDLPLGIRPEDTPANGLSLGETIRTIESNGSWAVLKNVERDSAYAVLLDAALEELRPLVEARTGPMLHREAFIFITSPGSITPFHMDPEHNILLQIRSDKTMHVFPTHDEETVPPQQSESFASGGHRNLAWEDRFMDRGSAVHLAPGEAVLMPVKAPHFVRNGPSVSVSFSITWRSERSVAEGELHSLNARLRAKGLPLVTVGHKSETQWIGRALFRLVNRLGWVA
ncbi:MAG: transcriptional regulator [Sphingobium sp.]|nr:transcriptional regulator [Sphingobium sp.]MBP6111123.1 transcriptional regulator [Sphingobium sp.]MBP8670899.1 transcriptional regulator [Sphingobium sp.]MBP9157986.1 transcriptional regulator [Sphingobium sp.]MCC6482894.1 transcriptional regulator [Sphingomonadaceae bacterium]